MKKVALCLSGQPRFFEKTFNSINENIILPNNADVFFHTWFNNPETSLPSDGFIKTKYHVHTDTKERLLDLYKPKSYNIESHKSFKNTTWNIQPTIDKFMHNINVNNDVGKKYIIDMIYSMWYSIFQANLVKEIYSLENNFTYDYVIRCRFDLAIPRKLICEELDTAALHLSDDRQQPNTLDDWFCVGNNKNMNVYSSLFPLINIYYEKCINRDGYTSNEHLIYEMIKHFNIDTKIINNFKVKINRE